MKFKTKEEFLKWYESDDIEWKTDQDYQGYEDDEMWDEIVKFNGKYYSIPMCRDRYGNRDLQYDWENIVEVEPVEIKQIVYRPVNESL